MKPFARGFVWFDGLEKSPGVPRQKGRCPKALFVNTAISVTNSEALASLKLLCPLLPGCAMSRPDLRFRCTIGDPTPAARRLRSCLWGSLPLD